MTSLRGLHLHVDGASGAAGDMMLGALLDLGVPVDVVGAALDAIEAEPSSAAMGSMTRGGAGRQRLVIAKVTKRGIAATDLKVITDPVVAPRVPSSSASGSFVTIKLRAEDHHRHVHVDEHGDKHTEHHAHAHHGHHAAHAHHRYADIRARIETAKLTDGTRTRALDIFDRLARAEAKLHGTTVADVVFHEVGAIDSIVDVVGTAAALDWLAPAAASCVQVAMGHGTTKSAHGTLPVPAPAALEVLREAGGVMTDGGLPRELCTPTGAAILAATITAWQPPPPGRAVAVGWGAGDVDLEDRPNVLRVSLIQPAAAAAADSVWQVDANIDDMSPELCAPALEAVFAAGAVDAWWTAITMKKGRPALQLSALVDEAARDAVIAAILRETTTIGVRFAPYRRTVLARHTIEVDTEYGKIPIKLASDGDDVRNAAPEYEACIAAAKRHGVPVKLVYAAALAAYGT